MDRNKVTQDIIKYLETSAMEEKERTMWTLFLPNMEDKHLEKLLALLKEEADAKANILLNSYDKFIGKKA